MQMSMFSAEEPLVKTTASDTRLEQRASGAGWMESALGSPSLSPELWIGSSRSGSFGRMFRTYWRHGIPADFSGLPQTLPSAGIMSPGECLISEDLGHPISRARVCSWSEIVIRDAPQRYYLSRKALLGIARRDRKPRLFSLQEGAWLSMTARHVFWTTTALE